MCQSGTEPSANVSSRLDDGTCWNCLSSPGTVHALHVDMLSSPLARILLNIGMAGGLLACWGCTTDASPSDGSSSGRTLGPCPVNETRTVSSAAACRLARSPAGEGALCNEICGRSFGVCLVDDKLKAALGLPDAGADADAGVPCPDGNQTIVCDFSACPGGRNVAPFVAPRRRPENGAEHFTQMAQLERVSVFAFRRLGGELALLGAPDALVAAAAHAAIEEEGHAKRMQELATAYGATDATAEPQTSDWSPRSLFEIALENATEGCVRESYGAVVAAYAARHAHAAHVRRVMDHIARDEAGHASWSWDLHAWALTKLSAAEQTLVADAMARARRELLASVAAPASTWQAECGVPEPKVAAAMIHEMDAALFGGAREAGPLS